MKKITKILPIFCILVTTILSIFFLDVNESKKYFQFNDYNHDFVSIKYNENIKINNDMIKQVLVLAKKNNVILEKSNISNTENNVKNNYLSLDTKEELLKFISKTFNLKKTNNVSDDNNAFIATYKQDNDNQIAIISDFLSNNLYNYYTFNNLFVNDGNLYGEYIVHYTNYDDFNKFSNELENLLQQDVHSYSNFSNSQQYIAILLVGSIIIIMLFYFIFQIYEIYYSSKDIACMKLLGFGKYKISYIMMKKRLKIYLYLIVFIFLLSIIFLKNINLYKLLFILNINLLLILLTYFINYMCIKLILKGYQATNILKKQNIALKISKISGKIKIVMISLLIISVSLLFANMSSYFDNLKVYNNSKELLNYGIINDLKADTPDNFNYIKQMNLFSAIYKDKNLDIFYSEFSKYYDKNEEEQKAVDEMYDEGTAFEYGSVDKNYLKKEKIIIYDLDHNEVSIDDLNDVVFLFPKSKIKKIDEFNKYYKERNYDLYEKYDIDYNFKAYMYDDQKVNTYRLNLKLKYVDSPILRVINDTIKISYIEASSGISAFGNGLTTGLKIQIKNSKEATFNVLEKHIENAELSSLIGIDNFLLFKDYFSDEIAISRTISIVLLMTFIVMLMVYVIISIQVISLYVKSENQKVMVKYLLGYNKIDIFDEIIKKNIQYNIFAFIITGIILLLMNQLNILLYLITIFSFMVVDFIILFLITKLYNFSKIYIELKGGSYD